MRRVIIHYCQQEGCDCLDTAGVIAYDGEDAEMADEALKEYPLNYESVDESARFNRQHEHGYTLSAGPDASDPNFSFATASPAGTTTRR